MTTLEFNSRLIKMKGNLQSFARHLTSSTEDAKDLPGPQKADGNITRLSIMILEDKIDLN